MNLMLDKLKCVEIDLRTSVLTNENMSELERQLLHMLAIVRYIKDKPKEGLE